MVSNRGATCPLHVFMLKLSLLRSKVASILDCRTSERRSAFKLRHVEPDIIQDCCNYPDNPIDRLLK